MKYIFITIIFLIFLLSFFIAPSTIYPSELKKSEKLPTIKEMIASYDWDYQEALLVANCESNLNPEALNDNPSTADYSIGIFQVNLYGNLADERPSEEWLKDPANNIEYAYKLYQERGWQPWLNCAKVNGII